MASQAVVDLVVNAADADRQLPRQISRIANEAERRAPDITLDVDLNTERLRRAIILESDFQAETLGRGFQRVTNSLDDNFARLSSSLTSELERITAQVAVTNSSIGRLDGSMRELGDSSRHAGDDLEHARRGADGLGEDSDRGSSALTRLTGILGTVGRSSLGLVTTGVRMTAMAGAASSALVPVAGLVTEITNMAPAAAVGVSALVTYAGAIGTLKLATSGVGDAISEIFKLDSDPKKVAEALKNLSPNARAFVTELQSMKKGFTDLRLDVQDRFFRGLDTTLKQTASATLPAVQKATRGFADTFNSMAQGVGNSAQELSRSGSLGKALNGSVTAFADLERIPGQVLNAIVRLAAGGAPTLNRLTSGLASVADTLTGKLNQAAQSGALDKAISQAVDTIGQLGRVAGNVFGAIGNILGVASEKGGGLFATLEKITQALESGTETPLFQKTLSSLISLGQTLVSNILPLVNAAFQVLAPVIQALVPPLEKVVDLLGQKLGELIPALQEPLTVLAGNVGLLLEALSPLISEGIDVLVETMPALTRLFVSLSEIIIELTPVIAALAPLLGDILVVAINLLVGALGVVNSTIATVIAFTRAVVEVFIDLSTTLVSVVVKAVDLVAAVLNGNWSQAWNLAKSIVRDALSFAYNAVRTFASNVLDAITRLGAVLPAGARNALNGLVSAAREKGNEAVQWVRNAGSSMIAAVSGYGARFYAAGRALVGSFVRGIASMVSAAADAAKRVVSAARDFLPFSPAKKGPLSGRGYPLYSGRAFTQSFAQGILSAAPSLDKAVGSLLGGTGTGGGSPRLSVAPTLTAGTGLLTAPQTRFTAQVAAPRVTVNIGNERLRQYMQMVIDDNDRRRDRFAAQGTGR